jgi:CBS domain-containing protein
MEDGMRAKEIMTAAPVCVTRDDTVRRAARLMNDVDIGFLPVVDDLSTMRPAGVITDRDITVRGVANGYRDDDTVAKYMTSGFLARVDPETPVSEVVRQMKERQLRRILVVGDEDRLVGVIAQADLATNGRDPREVADTVASISEPAEPRRDTAADIDSDPAVG